MLKCFPAARDLQVVPARLTEFRKCKERKPTCQDEHGVERNLTVDPSALAIRAGRSFLPPLADRSGLPIIPVVTICTRAFPVACLSRRSDHTIMLVFHGNSYHDSAPATLHRRPSASQLLALDHQGLRPPRPRAACFFNQSPEQLSDDQLHRYLLYLLHEKQVAWSSYNQNVAAIRFFYRVTYPKDIVITRLPYGKRPKRLPNGPLAPTGGPLSRQRA